MQLFRAITTSSLCGTGNLPSVASVTPTQDTCRLKVHGQKYRMHGPQVPSETTAITLVSYICHVEMHCHNEGSHLMRVDQVSSCKQPRTFSPSIPSLRPCQDVPHCDHIRSHQAFTMTTVPQGMNSMWMTPLHPKKQMP